MAKQKLSNLSSWWDSASGHAVKVFLWNAFSLVVPALVAWLVKQPWIIGFAPLINALAAGVNKNSQLRSGK